MIRLHSDRRHRYGAILRVGVTLVSVNRRDHFRFEFQVYVVGSRHSRAEAREGGGRRRRTCWGCARCDRPRALEALLRYQLRPPLSKARLTRLDDGRVKLRLRTPYNDGTSHLIFTAHEFLERLAALVPRPQKNLIIYHGCLAPRAKDRDKVVAYGRTGPERRHNT